MQAFPEITMKLACKKFIDKQRSSIYPCLLFAESAPQEEICKTYIGSYRNKKYYGNASSMVTMKRSTLLYSMIKETCNTQEPGES